jgi:hypothetical protein
MIISILYIYIYTKWGSGEQRYVDYQTNAYNEYNTLKEDIKTSQGGGNK